MPFPQQHWQAILKDNWPVYFLGNCEVRVFVSKEVKRATDRFVFCARHVFRDQVKLCKLLRQSVDMGHHANEHQDLDGRHDVREPRVEGRQSFQLKRDKRFIPNVRVPPLRGGTRNVFSSVCIRDRITPLVRFTAKPTWLQLLGLFCCGGKA